MEKYQQIIAVEPDVTIVVRAHGNLDVHQWDRSELGIITDINVQKIRHENRLLKLVFVEDCELSVPKNRELIIERVSDNARLRDLTNPLTINSVGGNLALQNVDSAVIGRVSDDCLVENITGRLKIMKVGGNLSGRNLAGALSAERVYDDVKLLAVGGSVEIRSEGNVEVGLLDTNHEKIFIRATDNIRLHLPADPDASLQIHSADENIQFETSSYKKKINENRAEIRLGNGEQKIVLDSSGNVSVTSDVLNEKDVKRLFADLDVLWEKLKQAGEVRRAARAKEVHWEIKMVEGVAKIAQEALEGADAIAGSVTEEALREAEMHVKDAMRKVQEQIRNLGYDMWMSEDTEQARETVSEEPEKEPEVSSEEKLIVMRLLQEQKISVEEADRLLQVLSETTNPKLDQK